MIGFLLGAFVWIPVGGFLWGLYGERILALIERESGE
jgi:hypothetical protein